MHRHPYLVMLLDVTLTTTTLTYRTIDPRRDAEMLIAHQLETCIASFGDDSRFQGAGRYLQWLKSKVEEFPEGFLLAFLDGRCVGHMELEVPFGRTVGYVSLFYVMPAFRGLGFGRLLHDRAELYFRSWEASTVRLHVSAANERALRFYRRMGYRRTFPHPGGGLWEMTKEL